MPYVVINTGMLPHQFSAFTEGLFGALHSEFERTPKAASVTGTPRAGGEAPYSVKVHWPYVLAEAFFVAYQLAWAALFLAHGLVLAAFGTTYIGTVRRIASPTSTATTPTGSASSSTAARTAAAPLRLVPGFDLAVADSVRMRSRK